MARTKASVGAKVSIGKSSKARCTVAPSSSTNSSSGAEKSSRSYSGGNPVCPRETPKWQKPITTFIFAKQRTISEDTHAAGSSKSKPKRKIIYSDDESDSEIKEKDNISKDTNSVNNESEVNVESQVYGESDVNAESQVYGESEVNVESDVNAESQVYGESEVNVESDVNAESQVYGESEVNVESDVNAESQVYGESEVNVESQVYGEIQDNGLFDSPPKNRELDESIILEPLSGENSHKLEEYYSTGVKGKGVGKKSNKENINNNKISYKRGLEEIEDSLQASKKVRVN